MAGKRQKFDGVVIQPEGMATEETRKADARIRVPTMTLSQFEKYIANAIKTAREAQLKTVKGVIDSWK